VVGVTRIGVLRRSLLKEGRKKKKQKTNNGKNSGRQDGKINPREDMSASVLFERGGKIISRVPRGVVSTQAAKT